MRICQRLRRGERVVRRSAGRGRRGQDRVTRVAVGVCFHRGTRRVAAIGQSAVRLRSRWRSGVDGTRVVLLRRPRSFAEVIGRRPRVLRARPVPGLVGSPLTHELVHPPRDPARPCAAVARLDGVIVLGLHVGSPRHPACVAVCPSPALGCVCLCVCLHAGSTPL